MADFFRNQMLLQKKQSVEIHRIIELFCDSAKSIKKQLTDKDSDGVDGVGRIFIYTYHRSNKTIVSYTLDEGQI